MQSTCSGTQTKGQKQLVAHHHSGKASVPSVKTFLGFGNRGEFAEKLVLISDLLKNYPEQKEAWKLCKFHLIMEQKLKDVSD